MGFFSFPVYWITYEIFFHNAELQWPWLTLGNGIGDNIKLIQWYEYTGVFGGSLWVLMINLLIYFIYKHAVKKEFKKTIPLGIVLLVVSMTPIVISNIIYNRYTEKTNQANVIIVQPSIDPYNEKFSGLTNEQQLDIMFKLAEENIDNKTDYVICPETAIDGSIWESEISSNPSIIRIKNFVFGHPRVKWVTGMSSYKMYKPGDEITYTCREYPYEKGFYYDYFNSAIQIDTTNNYPIYHKSKLVAGVEMMPYPKQLKLLKKLSIDLGGISGHAGTQSTRDVFFSSDKKFGIGPVICYESDFGEYMSGYLKNGANLIFVMTNDGWWGNTPGHRQHLTFSQIRAIELRRSIARSANTGISAIINQRGEVLESLSWWKRGVIKGTINVNSEMTFYARNGDYIGRFATYLAIFIFLFTIIRRFTLRRV
jgi:apolipoprotein N-acyltransferase